MMTGYKIPGLLALLILNIGSLPAAAQHASCANSWTNPHTKRWECLDQKFAKAVATNDNKPVSNSNAVPAELMLKKVQVTRLAVKSDRYVVSGQFANQGEQDRYISYAVVNLSQTGTPLQQFLIPVNATVAAGKSVKFSRSINAANLRDLDPALMTATVIKYDYR